MCSVPKVDMNKKFILDLSENENNRKYDNELLLTFKIKKKITSTVVQALACMVRPHQAKQSTCDDRIATMAWIASRKTDLTIVRILPSNKKAIKDMYICMEN